ncbi:MAG: 5-formyltetrahydrofolate cyclo-ligase [Firmicutes bacterium]|nr:5-formyltetrahydrofolate cyclo-ligase [Bacillota bacterium]
MIKDELRAEMRAKRRALTADEVRARSEKIKGNALKCIGGAREVCVFLSAFKEPDTAGIIQSLLTDDARVIVPVTDTDTNTITPSYLDDLSGLKKGAYGIYEPSRVNPARISGIDAVLVPGLAFDRRGGRMGFGRGYYDRFLSECRSIKIGLCYDFQLLDKIPTESHDVPMDYIITEKEILKVR